MRNLIVRSLILASALLVGAAHGQEYRVTSLPSIGGTISRGNSLNNRGQIAGWAENTVKA